jgi:hypothetical protein
LRADMAVTRGASIIIAGAASGAMERLLGRYSSVSAEDIERSAVEAFQRGELSEEHMERLVRFTATNNQIRQHGLTGLSLTPGGAARAAEEPLPEECKEIGLSEQEYAALRGDYGAVMGVSVERGVYKALLRKCKTKSALSLGHSEAKTRAFMIKKMKEMAAAQIRRRQRRDLMAACAGVSARIGSAQPSIGSRKDGEGRISSAPPERRARETGSG